MIDGQRIGKPTPEEINPCDVMAEYAKVDHNLIFIGHRRHDERHTITYEFKTRPRNYVCRRHRDLADGDEMPEYVGRAPK